MTALSRTSSVSSKNGKPVIMATNNSSTGGTSKQNSGKMPTRALSRSNSDRQKKGKKYIIWTPCMCNISSGSTSKQNGDKMPPRALSRSNFSSEIPKAHAKKQFLVF